LKDWLSEIHVLTHAELEQLFTVITGLRHRAMFLVAYRHGLRASEVSLLQKRDVDLATTKITVRR
jgi:integrase